MIRYSFIIILTLILLVFIGRDKPEFSDNLPKETLETAKLAQAGNPLAQYAIGHNYWSGQLGLKKDYRKAAYWLEKAYKAGVSEAGMELGVIYSTLHDYSVGSTPDIMRDKIYRGIRLLKEVFESDKLPDNLKAVPAQILAEVYAGRLGEDNLTSLIIPTDLTEAASWLTKAAELGDIDAQSDLGEAYLLQLGVVEDVNKALDLLTNTAKQGNRQAQCYLYYMNWAGIKTPKDANKAQSWFFHESYTSKDDKDQEVSNHDHLCFRQATLLSLHANGDITTKEHYEFLDSHRTAISNTLAR